MNIARFAFFAAVLFFSFIFLFSCSGENNPWLEGPSSSSAPAGGIELCDGIEYDASLFECKRGELVGSCKGKDYYPLYETCNKETGEITPGSSLSSSSSQGNQPTTCGGREYDREVFRCEDGELIGKCRGVDYYFDYEVCDNGEIKPKTSSSSGASSSSNQNNSSSSGGASSSSSNANDKVCGGIPYDSSVFRCESGELVGRCRGVDYYPAYEVCNNGTVETKADCKGVQFVPAIEFCSVQDSLVYNRCDGKTYNTNTQGCCGASVYTLSASYKCTNDILLTKCGSDFYDPKNEFCSGNAVYPKCADSTYNVATHGCKDDKITPKCGDSFYDSATEFCSAQDSLVYDKCNNAAFNTSTQGCCNNKLFTLATYGCRNDVITPRCGDSFYDSATEFCSAQETKVYDKCGGSSFNTLTQDCCSNTIYDLAAHSCSGGTLQSKIVESSFTDARDGKTYATSKIGNQTWMAENLNYSAEGRCYEDNADNCDRYGRLYTYSAAKTVCPSGWHLPSKAEWAVLIDYVGGASIAGGRLKANGGNEYKFSALMAGILFNSFTNIGNTGYWWTSTPDEQYSSQAYSHGVSSSQENIITNSGLTSRMYSVRCVK